MATDQVGESNGNTPPRSNGNKPSQVVTAPARPESAEATRKVAAPGDGGEAPLGALPTDASAEPTLDPEPTDATAKELTQEPEPTAAADDELTQPADEPTPDPQPADATAGEPTPEPQPDDEQHSETADHHRGGGFNPPVPTSKGGPDYGRFVEAVRTLQDHARAIDAPDAVITHAAGLIENLCALLRPYGADEWTSPSGRRMDLPSRGNVSAVPVSLEHAEDDRIRGTARFRRFHLGRNGAAHGGAIAYLFDSVLGYTAAKLTRSLYQRTAYLHVNYRHIAPIDTELQVDAGLDRVDGRKIFVSARVSLGETLIADGEALFIRLKPGQP